MPNVLVDEDELTALTSVNDANNGIIDTVLSDLAELKAELAKANESEAPEVDIQPLLDKANAIHDKLSGVETAPVVTTAPVPDPADAAEVDTTDFPVQVHADANPVAQTQENPAPQTDPAATLTIPDNAEVNVVPDNGLGTEVPAGESTVDDPNVPTT